MAYAAAYFFRVGVNDVINCVDVFSFFQWYVLPWLRGSSPVVEQLGVVNSSLTELNNNLTLNCKLALQSVLRIRALYNTTHRKILAGKIGEFDKS